MRNKIVIGTAQLGSGYGITNRTNWTTKDSIELLNQALSNDIHLLDTSPNYPNSEDIIGVSGNANNFRIISKFWINNPKSNQGLSSQLDSSMKSMKINQIYGYISHRPEEDLISDYNRKKIWEDLVECKKEDKVLKIGYSVYSVSQLEYLWANFKPDIVQLPLNILDQKFHQTGWLKRMKDNNVEVHVRSIFLQGLLLEKSIQEKLFPEYKNLWEGMNNIILKQGTNVYDYCLNFPFSISEVDKVIIGISNKNELLQLLNFKPINNIKYPPITDVDEKLINPSLWKK